MKIQMSKLHEQKVKVEEVKDFCFLNNLIIMAWET